METFNSFQTANSNIMSNNLFRAQGGVHSPKVEEFKSFEGAGNILQKPASVERSNSQLDAGEI